MREENVWRKLRRRPVNLVPNIFFCIIGLILYYPKIFNREIYELQDNLLIKL